MVSSDSWADRRVSPKYSLAECARASILVLPRELRRSCDYMMVSKNTINAALGPVAAAGFIVHEHKWATEPGRSIPKLTSIHKVRLVFRRRGGVRRTWHFSPLFLIPPYP